MRFLIDVCIGQALGQWLKEKGHDVVMVRDRDPRLSDDLESGAIVTATLGRIRLRH